MNIKSMRGFTLWELLVGLLVAGIVLGMGVPNLLEFRRNNAMASAANDLIGAIMLARAEAVKRQVFVTLCAQDAAFAVPTCTPTGAGSNGGYLVWVDESGPVDANGAPILTDATDGDAVVDAGEQVLLQRDDPQDITIFAASTAGAQSGYVSFGPNGFRRNVPALGATPSIDIVLFCDVRGNVAASGSLSAARVIRVDPTGRGQVLREVADINNAIAGPGLACP
jgi:type IV fimbrial biogenesis protein FimT